VCRGTSNIQNIGKSPTFVFPRHIFVSNITFQIFSGNDGKYLYLNLFKINLTAMNFRQYSLGYVKSNTFKWTSSYLGWVKYVVEKYVMAKWTEISRLILIFTTRIFGDDCGFYSSVTSRNVANKWMYMECLWRLYKIKLTVRKFFSQFFQVITKGHERTLLPRKRWGAAH
jgi:hypothetical protein